MRLTGVGMVSDWEFFKTGQPTDDYVSNRPAYRLSGIDQKRTSCENKSGLVNVYSYGCLGH
jgi:hypothetical protein